MTVDLFITCLNDALFPSTGRATVKLLERLGHKVRFHAEQTCCGQMHLNTGYRQEALALARRFVSLFRDAECVVSPSGSCVGMVRELYPKIAEWSGDSKFEEEARTLGERVFELSEFLVKKLGVDDVGAYYPHTVTLHTTCHSLRMIHVGEAPARLLSKVEGLTLVPLSTPEQCCGFGGTFSVKNSDTSSAMLKDKLADILGTGAKVCSAGDNSCLMHILGGLSREKLDIKTVHLAEILASTREGEFK